MFAGDARRRDLLIEELDRHTRPVRRLGAGAARVRSGDGHGSIVEGAAQGVGKELEHLFGDAVEGGGLVRVHALEQGAEGIKVTLERKPPLCAVATEKLGPWGLAQGSVKPDDAGIDGASAKVGIVDAPIDGARLRPNRRRLADPLARTLDAVPVDRRLVVTKQSHDSAVRSIVLHRPPHRSNDGVATAACHRVGNPLPQRAIGPSL